MKNLFLTEYIRNDWLEHEIRANSEKETKELKKILRNGSLIDLYLQVRDAKNCANFDNALLKNLNKSIR